MSKKHGAKYSNNTSTVVLLSAQRSGDRAKSLCGYRPTSWALGVPVPAEVSRTPSSPALRASCETRPRRGTTSCRSWQQTKGKKRRQETTGIRMGHPHCCGTRNKNKKRALVGLQVDCERVQRILCFTSNSVQCNLCFTSNSVQCTVFYVLLPTVYSALHSTTRRNRTRSKEIEKSQKE